MICEPETAPVDVLLVKAKQAGAEEVQHPSLNPEAQALYEAAGAGEAFQYCNVNFRRLSNDQIVEICGQGAFRATPRV